MLVYEWHTCKANRKLLWNEKFGYMLLRQISIFSFAEDYLLPTFYDASAKQIALEAVYVQENC